MFGHKGQVGTIEEGLSEVGLDPSKVIGEMERMTGKLAEARAGGPPIRTEGAPSRAAENRSLYEGRETPRPAHAPQGGGGKPAVVKTLKAQAFEECLAAGIDPSKNIEEAFKVVKKKRKSAAQKLASRLYRKSKKAALRVASRMYRKRNKRKILLRAKKKIKKFGSKMLAKLHKAGKRIVMSNDQALANLREDLNSPSGSAEKSNSYEEAAFNAGMLSMYLGEVFEVLGDEESAETMFSLSDQAADLAEALEAIEEGDLSDTQEERLRKILSRSVQGLKVWEGLGSPTLYQAIEASQATGE